MEEVPLIDEILKTRIAEVRRTLQRTSLARLRREDQQPGLIDPESAWNSVAIYLPELDKAVLNVVQKSWEFLESQFRQASGLLVIRLERLQDKYERLAGTEDDGTQRAALIGLWKEYDDLEKSAESLFGEIVELMGGLALRDRSVDPWLFAMADRLVGWYTARTSDSWDAVTVPWVRAAATRTLVRIVGLRLPEWNIWALPLTAYEFAHQYLRFGQRTTEMRNMIATELGQGQQIADQEVLLADAFATFITGPAYLLAAIGLRLSPL